MTRNFIPGALLVSTLLSFPLDASAQARQQVSFARGAESATVRGSIRGYAYRDHIVSAREGQTISVSVKSPNTFTVFSIFLPDGTNLDGAIQMDSFTGELPASGDYVIRVGMMRAEARRRGSVSNYSLNIKIR